MNRKRSSTIPICLTAILALSPVASFAQATTTFSGEAVALRANAVGISLALSDTGPLAASGGNLSTSLASVNVLGLASADALKSTTSGGGTSSQSQSSVANLSLLGGLVAANVVKSNSSATCSGGQATVTGNAELRRLGRRGPSPSSYPTQTLPSRCQAALASSSTSRQARRAEIPDPLRSMPCTLSDQALTSSSLPHSPVSLA